MQKNFPTELAARTFMHGLIAAANQGETSRPRVATTIFPEDAKLREAELAWQRLRQKMPRGSLITAIDYYLANAGEMIKDGVALEILDQFCARRRERGNKENTIADGRIILRKFLTEAGVSRISEFTPDRRLGQLLPHQNHLALLVASSTVRKPCSPQQPRSPQRQRAGPSHIRRVPAPASARSCRGSGRTRFGTNDRSGRTFPAAG
jgi:hypothetical protein